MIEDAELTGDAIEHGHLLRGVALHDLLVFVVRRLTAHLPGDVVLDESLHGRLCARGRGVPWRLDIGSAVEAIRLVHHAEDLGVGVEPLLAGVGARSIEIRADVCLDDSRAIRGLVLGPCGHGVGQVLAEDALEGLATIGAVELAQHVVERPVLEENQDHVVHRVRAGLRSHKHSPRK